MLTAVPGPGSASPHPTLGFLWVLSPPGDLCPPPQSPVPTLAPTQLPECQGSGGSGLLLSSGQEGGQAGACPFQHPGASQGSSSCVREQTVPSLSDLSQKNLPAPKSSCQSRQSSVQGPELHLPGPGPQGGLGGDRGHPVLPLVDSPLGGPTATASVALAQGLEAGPDERAAEQEPRPPPSHLEFGLTGSCLGVLCLSGHPTPRTQVHWVLSEGW